MSDGWRVSPTYEFEYHQLLNVFGAPGIPNEYQATLYRNGKVVHQRRFWWRFKAEKQCERWASLYGARPAGDA